ncbi:MAG: hypothetical protein SOY73_00945 [Blautia sp.]|nr:hypothetical protein [Blautia sp.]
MGYSIREALECFNNTDLIELIIEYSDNGYFPLELFLLRTDVEFSAYDLENFWNGIYVKAQEMDQRNDDMGVQLLRDGAEMCFEKAKMLSREEDKQILCKEIASDLQTAAEEDGIGMKNDSEWVYLEIKETIEDYLR